MTTGIETNLKRTPQPDVPAPRYERGTDVYGRPVIDGAVVRLSSGRLVVGDPTAGDAAPFNRTVRPGKYLVLVSRISWTVTSSLVRFSSASPTRWEPAGTAFGRGRKTAIMDQQTYEKLRGQSGSDVYGDAVVLTSTVGDGSSVSYWGLDDHDDVCCLFIDFRQLPCATCRSEWV